MFSLQGTILTEVQVLRRQVRWTEVLAEVFSRLVVVDLVECRVHRVLSMDRIAIDVS